MKLNSIDKYKELNESLLNQLKNVGWIVDRWGHATYETDNGKKYRWKFGRTSVRKEIQVVHEATNYSKKSTSWVRLKTIYYKNVKKKS